MDDDKIEAVGKALRSDDHRLRAIGIISAVDPLPQHLVESWIDDVVFALENDDNAFNQLEILKELERMAKAYPGLATTAVPVVAREVDQKLRSSNGEEQSSDHKINYCTSILQAIVDDTEATRSFSDFSPDELNSFFQYGDPTRRSLGYRLFGRIATPLAIRKLVREPSNESGSVLDSRKVALQEAATIVAGSLSGDERLTTGDAIVSFSELYATGAIAESEALNHIQSLSLDSLLVEGEDVERVRIAIQDIAEKSGEVARPIADESLTLLEEDPEDPSTLWEALKGIAEGAPDVVLDNSERLLRLVEGADPSSLSEALDVLSFVPRHEPTPVYRTIADRALTLLERDTEEGDVTWRILSRVAEGSPEVVSENSERIASLIDNSGADPLSEALDVVSFSPRSGTIRVYHTVAERAFTLLEEGLEERDDVWHLLSRVSKRAPEAVLQRSERLVELIDGGVRIDTVEGLGVTSTIGGRRSTLPPNLGKVALRA
jgi:hypothetical protein